MIVFNKEIKPEKVTMWINIAGFVTSLIFYLNVEQSFVKPSESLRNPLQDSLRNIDFRLASEIRHLRTQQDSLVKILSVNKSALRNDQSRVVSQRTQIETTLNTDWELLPQKQRENYTATLLHKLKQKRK